MSRVRLSLAALIVLTVISAGASTASAASLTITVGPENKPPANQSFKLSESGSTEEAAKLIVYVHPAGPACGATIAEEKTRPGAAQGYNAIRGAGESIPAGTINFKTEHQAPSEGSYLACGYVYFDSGGHINAADNLPEATATAGPFAVKADSDGDGVPNDTDACPDQSAPGTSNGCTPPDSDHDGVPDAQDGCPSQGGPASNGGCPVPPPPDGDGDFVPDSTDACPTQSAPGTANGCKPVPPDADGDGRPDAEDHCPSQPGPAAYGGCPDTDGDGVADTADLCPTVRGSSSYADRGCPPDGDRDGVLDDVDPCPTVAGEANGGCGTFEVQGLQFGQANAKVKRGDFLKAIKAGPRGSRLRMATGCEYKPDMPGSPRPSLRVKCKGGAALSFSPATARALGLSKAKALIDRVTVDPKKVEYGEGHDDGWPVIFVFKPKLSKALLGKLAKLKVIELVMTSYVTDPQGKRVDRKPAKTTFKG